jgi:oligoribonuclease NrnB/cAMP/cGMP phosphodiesterase (DHH superfamily)
MNINPNKFDIIVYHEYCSDGTASAWIVKRHNPYAQLINCKAGQNPNLNMENIKSSNIIFVDICPSVDYLLTLCNIANKVVILDHHISAYRNIEEIENKPENLFTLFDMNRSGCMITWDFFNSGLTRPWFIDYIGDRDLWKWELPNSKNINTALFEEKHITFNGLNILYDRYVTKEQINKLIEDMNERGNQINKFRNELIEKETKKAIHCTFQFEETLYNVWLYNGPEDLRSDIGNALMQINFKNGLKPDFSINWRYDVKTHEFWLSMRGEEWSPDLSVICRKYNGGGHPKASGCSMSGNIELRSVFVPNNY